jgi:hypothetical protein
MHSPTASVPDRFETPSLSYRILAGILIGICLIFLLSPEVDQEAFFDFQTAAGLIGAAAVFCLLYRFWPGERQ